MNDEILIINEYPIGWGWLKDVPLIDWEWLIDVFATMTDDTDTYSYITYAEEDGAKLTDITFVRTVGLAKFLYDDQGYLAGIREYGHYIAAKALDIKSERDYLNHYISNYRDMEVQDVIHSFNEDPAKAKQEIIDQVNDIYSDGTESYTTMEEVLGSFTFKVGASQGKAYIESQEISFNRGGTIINKEL